LLARNMSVEGEEYKRIYDISLFELRRII